MLKFLSPMGSALPELGTPWAVDIRETKHKT